MQIQSIDGASAIQQFHKNDRVCALRVRIIGNQLTQSHIDQMLRPPSSGALLAFR